MKDTKKTISDSEISCSAVVTPKCKRNISDIFNNSIPTVKLDAEPEG